MQYVLVLVMEVLALIPEPRRSDYIPHNDEDVSTLFSSFLNTLYFYMYFFFCLVLLTCYYPIGLGSIFIIFIPLVLCCDWYGVASGGSSVLSINGQTKLKDMPTILETLANAFKSIAQ